MITSIDTRPTPGELAHETWFVLSGGLVEFADVVWRSLGPKRRDIWEAVAERVICRFLADHLEVDDTLSREELERMLCEWGNDDRVEPVGRRSSVFTSLAPSQAAVDHAARLASAAMGEQESRLVRLPSGEIGVLMNQSVAEPTEGEL